MIVQFVLFRYYYHFFFWCDRRASRYRNDIHIEINLKGKVIVVNKAYAQEKHTTNSLLYIAQTLKQISKKKDSVRNVSEDFS